MTRLPPSLVILAVIVASVLFTAPPAGAQSPVQVTVSFAQAEYTVAEGEEQQITVNLSRDPQRTVVIPITVGTFPSGFGVTDATVDDYSVPDSVTFNSGQISRTITFMAVDDTVDDDDEGVALEFGATLPPGVTAGTQSYTDVLIDDDDIPEMLTVEFVAPREFVNEGTTADILLRLSDVPEREIDIPITVTNFGGATSADYSPIPSTVTFDRDKRWASFEFTPTEDNIDDDGEGVLLSIGTPLPTGVSLGPESDWTSTIFITDGGEVHLGLAQVGLGSTALTEYHFENTGSKGIISNEAWQWQRSTTEIGTYADIPAAEGGTSNPYIPSESDLGMWLKAKVTFDATHDPDRDEFGELIDGVAIDDPDNDVTLLGRTTEAITRQPVLSRAAVSNAGFSNATDQTITYSLNQPTTHQFAQGFTTGPDPRGYILLGARLALRVHEGEPRGTWAVHADDGGKPAASPVSEAVQIPSVDNQLNTFEDLTTPLGVPLQPHTKYWFVISRTNQLQDGDFGVSTWGMAPNEFLWQFFSGLPEVDPDEYTGEILTITSLDRIDPDTNEHEPSRTGHYVAHSPADDGSQEGWSLDITSLAWIWDVRRGSFAEYVGLYPWTLLATAMGQFEPMLVIRMSVLIAPEVTVQFGAADYTATEGGDTASIEVELSEAPRRILTIPIMATGQDGATADDYEFPGEVTFQPGETSQTITLTPVDDTVDDDDESVKLEFGTTPDAYVTTGTRDETTVAIVDNDFPELTVEYGQDSQLLAEGEMVQVTVRLSAVPEREVTVPLTATGQDGATDADYTVPTSVTFGENETEKTVAFTAEDDDEDDDDESVKLGFDASNLPERITVGARSATTLDIGDNDNPTVTVTFAETSYTVAEGGMLQVTVDVSADPERTIIIPITAVPQGTASDADYTVMPSVTFHSEGTTTQTFAFEATQDLIDDDNEMVTLEFGTMPDPKVSAGTPGQTGVTIQDDDTAGFLFSPSPLTVHEGGSAAYTVTLTSEPSAEMTVNITAGPGSDLSPVGDTLTFTADNWTTPQVATVTAALDDDSENDEDVLTHTGGGAVEYDALTRDLPVIVVDKTGDLRLVDGERTDEDGNLCEGRLEIFLNGEWGSICDDYWTPEDADVACRQLGFVGGSVVDTHQFIASTARKHTYFPPGTGEFWLDDLKCNGAESSLLECPAVRGNAVSGCRRFEEVGLRCVKAGAPWISDIQISAPAGNDDQYDAGETIEVTLVWSEPVVVTTPAGGQPATLVLNHTTRNGGYTATYARGSGTDRTVFTYTAQEPAPDIYVLANNVRHRDSTIRSQATAIDAHLKHGDYYKLWPRPARTAGQPASVVGQPAFNDPGMDGSFGPGDTVEVTLTFSREVLVDRSGGHPTVLVRLGGTDERIALYREDPEERLELSRQGRGMEQLVFAYTLGHRDGTHSSLELDANVLSLNGGAIRDVEHGLNVSLHHQAASPLSLMQVLAEPEVDSIAPQLQSADVNGGTLELTYSETLDNRVPLSTGAFAVNVNGDSRAILGGAVGGSEVQLLLFPPVEAGDTVTVDYTAHTQDGLFRVQDTSGNAASSFRGQAVTNNTTSSSSGRSVEVSAPGVPTNLQLALHQSGSLKATWEAPDSGPVPDGYTVQWKTAAGNWEDPDQVSETDVTKTSYVISSLDDGVEYAVRVLATSNEVAGDPSGEVTATPRETTPPTVSSATVDGASLTLTFNETLNSGETPDPSAFAVAVGGTARSVDTVTVSGSTVVLNLVTAAFAGDSVTVSYTDPADGSAARVKDLAGNAAASFTGQQVANGTQEAEQLTAAASSVPDSHNGDFTFELRFSEEPKENFSYKTMRDHAFTVTGGVVTNSRRLDPPKNAGWEVHITPAGNGAVTIVLPVTTDCTAQGAICTSDRRPLSNRLVVEVPGS